MKKQSGKVRRDWSFLIFIGLFGCIYLAAFGLPMYGGGTKEFVSWGPIVEDLQGEVNYLVSSLKAYGLGVENDSDSANSVNGNDSLVAAGVPEEMDGPQEFAGTDSEKADSQEIGAEESGTEENVAEEIDTGEDGIEENSSEEVGTEEVDSEESDAETEPEPEPESIYQTVEDDYFADAIFIGDSRTVGLYKYGGIDKISTFCCSTGLTVYKLFDDKNSVEQGQVKKRTAGEVLAERQYSAVYLMIGINEMGTGTVDSFIETYQKCVDRLRELQPDAIIYLQGIMRVTTKRSSMGNYINNEGIDARNEGIAGLADNETIFYLDINPLVSDESGGLIEEYSFDGVHMYAQYYDIWMDYLRTHAVNRAVVDAPNKDGGESQSDLDVYTHGSVPIPQL